MPRTKEYKIDLGNSYPGPVGYVAYTETDNKKEALKKFKDCLPLEAELSTSDDVKVIVFLNTEGLKLSDVKNAND